MTSSLLFWVVLAVLAFWAVGAYNRLVRKRSEANTAFGALEAEFAKQVALALQCLPEEEEAGQSQFEGGSAFWSGLRGAVLQFNASLAAAKARPLDPERMAALGAAHEVLNMSWDRAERDDAHDLAGPRLPENISAERQQLVRLSVAATEQFNNAVAQYNDAIDQFPASVLAWIFGFRAARGLRARP
ncbi:LemA family protein [Ramlibacter albus]|uniref:LemA family protein n=1 Tax=Ramlibacter albus TaxID=2079448 RepID=A0A923S4H4_9BURK|nr:LemA family protein [Ramlibacter albus]MBC5764137.1 LemA family protein [Ramlibacter albus]